MCLRCPDVTGLAVGWNTLKSEGVIEMICGLTERSEKKRIGCGKLHLLAFSILGLVSSVCRNLLDLLNDITVHCLAFSHTEQWFTLYNVAIICYIVLL